MSIYWMAAVHITVLVKYAPNEQEKIASCAYVKHQAQVQIALKH